MSKSRTCRCRGRGLNTHRDEGMTMDPTDAPRPPEGDWLGSKFLRFERDGRVATVTVDRPEARNALTGAMYFGIRYAVNRVDAADDLDGLIITGTGDVFIPGGDLTRTGGDMWMNFELLGMDCMPFSTIMNSTK